MNTRTYEFGDFQDNVTASKSLTGLEYLQQMMNGALPQAPAVSTNAIIGISCDFGKATFAIDPQPFHFNAVGTVHGGVISTLLDTAMGCTLMTTLPKDKTFTTLELKVNFLKAITLKTKSVFATGKIIHQGKSTAYIEASLVDENNVIYAHSVCTCMILDKR